MNIPEEGFYYLVSDAEPDPVLVHGYRCTDMDGAFVFGFNTYDGGVLLPLSDLSEDVVIMRAIVTSGDVFKR